MRTAVTLVVSMGIALCAAADTPKKKDPLEKLLTDPVLSDGWARDGDADVYFVDTVFELINGEAELFFPYGFKRVVAASYIHDGDADNPISLELYEMGSFLEGFGIYSNFRYEESEIVKVGSEGFGGGTQIIFYQGPFFLKLMADDPEQYETLLLPFARAIAKALPPQRGRPAELALLDVDELVPNTRQFVAQSMLGYAFFKHGLLAEAEIGEKRVRPFVVFEDSPEAVAQTIAAYKAYLAEEDVEPVWMSSAAGRVLSANDPLHKGVILQKVGSRIIGIARLENARQGIPLLKKLQTKALPKPKSQSTAK